MSRIVRGFTMFVCVSSGMVACAGVALDGAPSVLLTKLFVVEFTFSLLLGIFVWTTPPDNGAHAG